LAHQSLFNRHSPTWGRQKQPQWGCESDEVGDPVQGRRVAQSGAEQPRAVPLRIDHAGFFVQREADCHRFLGGKERMPQCLGSLPAGPRWTESGSAARSFNRDLRVKGLWGMPTGDCQDSAVEPALSCRTRELEPRGLEFRRTSPGTSCAQSSSTTSVSNSDRNCGCDFAEPRPVPG
jgi:hypothetical protein